VLQQLGIQCECRGAIKVKSMTNLVTTYFVHFDENFQLIQDESVQNSDHDSVLEENEVRDYEERYKEERQNNITL
jgi:hypothetical protein